jgi:hypothetical protein
MDKKSLNCELIAYCGFYCGCCPSNAEGSCSGCRARGTGCFSSECAISKGLYFCSDCEYYPCDALIQNEKSTVLSKEWLIWKKEQKKST